MLDVAIVFIVLGCIDVDVVGASKGRINVIDLDFGFGFWKEYGDY